MLGMRGFRKKINVALAKKRERKIAKKISFKMLSTKK